LSFDNPCLQTKQNRRLVSLPATPLEATAQDLVNDPLVDAYLLRNLSDRLASTLDLGSDFI
jgi:hypothetical protein